MCLCVCGKKTSRFRKEKRQKEKNQQLRDGFIRLPNKSDLISTIVPIGFWKIPKWLRKNLCKINL